MRILQLVQKPQRRGAEIFAAALGTALRALGEEVRTAYLYDYAGSAPLDLAPGDVALAARLDHPFERVPGWHPGLTLRLLSLLDRYQPDIVQLNGARTVKYGALLRRLRRTASFRVVYRNIGDPANWVRGPLHRTLFRRLVMPSMDGVVAVSRNSLASLHRFYRLDAIPVAQIPRGVESARVNVRIGAPEVRLRVDTLPTAPVILAVGSLTPEKRLDRMLRVFASVRSAVPEAVLWIVGDGPLRAPLEEQAQAVDDGAGVRWLGAQEDVGSLLGAADVLLLTSDTEGIPGVLLEAGASGLAVVATRVGGVAECVEDGLTGLLAEPEDEPRLVQAVVELLREPQRAARMGGEGRRLVTERFSIDRIARRYVEFYRRVCRGKAPVLE